MSLYHAMSLAGPLPPLPFPDPEEAVAWPSVGSLPLPFPPAGFVPVPESACSPEPAELSAAATGRGFGDLAAAEPGVAVGRDSGCRGFFAGESPDLASGVSLGLGETFGLGLGLGVGAGVGLGTGF